MAKFNNNNKHKNAAHPNNKSKQKSKNNRDNRIKTNNNQEKNQLIDLKCLTIQQLYDIAEAHYIELKSKTKNDKWNDYISQKGTKKDKITFIASEIIKKPQSSLDNFELLSRWTLDPNPNFALPACQAITNIYIQHIFVEKPALKVFLDSVQQYIKTNKKDSTVKKGDLVGFYLEHHIKHFYGEMLRGITELLTSTISHIKKTSIQLLASLSRFKELRRSIFSTLINKFGDSDLEIVNEVSKSLKSQFYEDVLASQVLLQQANAFLFRQNLAQKSQFYVVNFLNNINLKFFSEKSLTKLFDLFFHFFNKLMDIETEEKSISSRFFLNSIKGLNRIFAYMKTGNKETRAVIEEKVEKVYKTFHKTQNTKAKVQLLLFLFQSCTTIKGAISDRFYRVLYEFLGSNQIVHCSIVQMFFDLLLICMKEDQNLNRTLAFIKRLLQLCFEAETNFIATCLILINKVILEKDPIQIMMKQKENSLEDSDDIVKDEASGERQLPYDMNKREPLYAGAEKTNLWELIVFKNHYHPTVRMFTEHVLKNSQIPYSGNNPILELSLTSFVEKLSLRKQKKSDSWKIKVKRNLSKIRTSKYESLLEKPLESFKEDELFIRKYLQKRDKIHQNKKAMQTKDIQDFADQVIEREMDRLNPRDQSLDELSISQDQLEGEEIYEGEGEEEELEDDFQGAGQQSEGSQMQEGSEKQQFLGQFDEDEDEFGDDEDLRDEEGDFDQNQEILNEQNDEDEEQPQNEKDFDDVFDDIGDSPQYPKKKKNGIVKRKEKFNKNKGTDKNQKSRSYKNMKKQHQKNSKNVSFKKNKKR